MKKLLIIIPYKDIYPPVNGGMQRCFHILNQSVRFFDVTIIIKQDKNDFLKAVKEYPALSNIEIFSTVNEPEPKDIFLKLPIRIKNALRYRWYKKTLSGPTNSGFVESHYLINKILKKGKFDIILLENGASLYYVNTIRKLLPKTKIIFDAHNVDSDLALQDLNNGLITKKDYLDIYNQEKSFRKQLDAIIVCSKRDLERLKDLNENLLSGVVIPNGVVIYPELYNDEVLKDLPQAILFCGSLAYPPNSEGLSWFWENVWPVVKVEFPCLKLIVLGSGKLPLEFEVIKKDTSVTFTGRVEDVRTYYKLAAISIVPLKTGSGTRLKILEAMGFGVPVISTTKGAEGIDYESNKNIVIADDTDSFSKSIIDLLKDKEKRIRIQREARKLAERKYDWNKIGDALNQFLADCKPF